LFDTYKPVPLLLKRLKPEDVARLAPLGFSHCTMLGRYYFELSEEIRGGQLRPLRNPANIED